MLKPFMATMRSLFLLLLLFLLLTKSKLLHAEDEEEQQRQQTCIDDKDELECPVQQQQQEEPVQLFCGVYMAPSTLDDGDSNLGMYTSQKLQKGDVVNFPEIAIPLLFREWDVHPNPINPDGQIWERYIWEGSVMGIESKNESNTHQCGSVFVPGVGCTVNSMLEMANVHSTRGSEYHTFGLHRSRDASVGSFSPYHGAKTIAKVTIDAGSELFASYGDDWIPSIPGAIVTTNENIDKAEDFMHVYKDFVDRHEEQMDDEFKEALWNYVSRRFPYQSRVLDVLPRTEWNKVEQAINRQQQQQDGGIVRHFVRESGKRTLEWLKEHGKCQDHMVPRRSTLHLAGMGAFANRNLPKGTVVGYAPLIHIGKAASDLLQIQYKDNDEYTYSKQDLIINYSFGHADSTLILTPYGAMVNYINHNQTLANVKVQWPTTELLAHKPEWLLKDVDYIANTQYKIGLSFDYVALRDIEEGEEIFMDYGNEWEEAWLKHVQTYQPGDAAYTHSSRYKQPSYLRTPSELERDPYPPNLQTVCIESFQTINDRLEYMPKSTHERIRCKVLERNNNGRYTVEMFLSNQTTVTVHKVPWPQGIQLVDKVRSADWHLPNAFRHPILIPDEVFPDAWKNKN